MSEGSRCGRPGCGGTFDEDGYCDECGHAATSALDSGPATMASTAGATATASSSTAAATATATGPGSGSVGTTGTRPTRRGSGRSTGTGSARSRLGAGLVDVPAVPLVDPATALLTDPQVAEDKRFCSKCKEPVGRTRDDRPGRAEGFCPRDGAPFSFRPKLTTGELVAGQYDVQGCLAYGGLGWIYLALDRAVNNRWVVLKGLLDTSDPDAMAAAQAEKDALAKVSHPNIVAIHNFVQHPDDDNTLVDYIVMEYVGGSSLKQLMEDRRRADRTFEPMPVGQAIAYAMEMLPALGYLHARGLAYCDFKPDNVIQYDRQVKLIDLGGVIRIDDRKSALFGTPGYQAPEFAKEGPSPSSDVHTVGRTLAVLALGMAPQRRGIPTPLPTPAEHPVLAAHESFYRLLVRATDPDPLRRFGSTDEMAEQLGGVLREALSTDDALARPAVSSIFEMPQGAFAPGLLTASRVPGRPDPTAVAELLPAPLVDTADPAAALLATIDTVDRDEVVRIINTADKRTSELRFRLVRAHLAAGDAASARTVLEEQAHAEPDDWRLEWFGGVAALLERNPGLACTAFDTVYATLPGEVAPKLALAAAAECAGDDARAGRYYAMIARPDPSLADAAFGLARVRLRAGDRAGAIAALDATPESSSRYVPAQLAAVEATLLGNDSRAVDEAELRAAAVRAEKLTLDRATDQEVRATLLTAAVKLSPTNGGASFLACAWRERDLRLALETCLRTSARLTSDAARRIELVDRANDVRPRTWV